MGLYNLDKIFNPASIAVIGASDRAGSIGHSLMENLIKGEFGGKIFPVNGRCNYICGLKSASSILRVTEPVDLAIIATPINTVPSIINECVRAKVGGAIIISAGGKETGAAGREIEQKIIEQAGREGLRIVGPNCLGVICPGSNLNASFASHVPLAGKMAFISQSGAICTATLDFSLKEKIGFSHFVSIGSMLDVDFGDLIDYLGNDPKVKSILLYIESLTNYRKFMSAARAVSRVKPIIVLKSGRSPAGARAASSHTGAMAGEDAIYDAAFKRAGIVRVNTIRELFDCAGLLAKTQRPRGCRLAIVTNAGGPGVMAADALAYQGVEPVPLSAVTMAKLDAILPAYWSRNNPIDVLGDAPADLYVQVVETCVASRDFDGVLAIFAPQALTDPALAAQALVQAHQGSSFPLFASWMGGFDAEKGRETLNNSGIPTYDTPEQAVRAFMYMYEYSRNMEMLQAIPSKFTRSLTYDKTLAGNIVSQSIETGQNLLMEAESKRLLAAYGLPVNRMATASSAEEAVRLARDIGYPLALKIYSPDIIHKTDANGVQLDIRNETDVCSAYEDIMKGAASYNPLARILGVTLQPMIHRPDFEILMGAKKDPNMGPVIMFGLGGIYTEILRDRAIGLPPLNRLLARTLMEETRVFRFLNGYRHMLPANFQLLQEMLIRLAQLVTDFPEIVELDMNPVVIKDGQPLVVDARVILEKTKVAAPLHLIISPYPAQYEHHAVTAKGLKIFVRPIKPEDAPLLQELFNVLSPTTIYRRFFSPLKTLPSSMLARFTQIDYDREIALVAVDGDGEKEMMLGVARLIGDPDGREAEFAVLVGDPWQGQGVGVKLLESCLHIARERGIKNVFGTVLRENTNMLAMGRKIGFEVHTIPHSNEYRLNIDLDKWNSTERSDDVS